MNTRPKFENITCYAEFEKYYWYREELQSICKSIGIEYEGNKLELNNYIKEYFCGNKIPHKPKKKTKEILCPLSLETPLINCGFKFTQRFRDYFSSQTGIKNFKFNTDMVATVKKVKETNDTSFTIGDLLEVYYGKKEYAKYDNSSCQWNKFLKDFYADEYCKKFTDKFDMARKFWNLLKQTDLPKKYSREFITRFEEKININ